MLSPYVPTYSIDLTREESRRWAEVISRETEIAGKLIAEAAAEFERVPELLRWVFARVYKRTGGLYVGEIQAWSDAVGVSVGTVTMLNCAYELSHIRWGKLFGCTAGVLWVDGLGMIHVRNLDWPLDHMGPATRVFRFHRGAREFVSVGVPGQVGVLSGMLPGAYSCTINWAPPAAFPSFEFGPTFLLRDTLETCDTYDDAVRKLQETPMSTSVFFTICGTERGQACVIERTPNESMIRPPTDGVLVQANHHVVDRFAKHNAELNEVVEGEEVFSIEGSTLRVNTLRSSLAEIPSNCTLADTARVLDIGTVLNSMTCQQMVFRPATGDLEVWHSLPG